MDQPSTEKPMSLSRKAVCVIGAGPSGLVAARELRKEGHRVVVFEQKHDVGGQWLYDPKIENENPLGKTEFLDVHSSIYTSLRLISPREIMGYTDFPFFVKEGRDTRRFPGHKELWLYLKDFSVHFGLREMIRFNTRVEYVGMLDYHEEFGKEIKWVVKSRSLLKNGNSNKTTNVGIENNPLVEEVYDAVVIANGHYSYPRLPSIKGMEKWKRKQMHSHVYRVPEGFKDQVVVVVGNSLSGQDIAMELVRGVANQVHISARSQTNLTEGFLTVISKHDNLHLRPQIKSLEEDGRVMFVDGSWVVADAIVYCTGYTYSFPFLDTKGIVSVDDNRVGPLYHHTFPPLLSPSLSIVGIPTKVIAFPFFESQGKWIAQVLSGKRTLPSVEDMVEYVHQFYRRREADGVPKHNTHDIQFEDCDKYADLADFPHLEEWRKKLCISAVVNSHVNLETYRDSWDDEDFLQETLQSPHFTQPLQPPTTTTTCL
ncbi:Flavin-containing monooxygenase FMO GS-OX-like 9 [Linum grandiflorum]